MQGKRWRRQRKAVSPVLATVILIAITLIASVAIAGFVFGLFGGFTSTANVQVTYVSIKAASGTGNPSLTGTPIFNCSATSFIRSAIVNMTTLNTGSATTSVFSLSITTAGQTFVIAVPSNQKSCVIGTGTTYVSVSNVTISGVNKGQAYTGSLSLANGAQVQFSGYFV